MSFPRPQRKPVSRVHHGNEFVDPYAWLADGDDPEVLAHLQAENAYSADRLSHMGKLRDEIFNEIKGQTQETDMSVPVRDGDWWYLRRTTEGVAYPTFTRIPLGSGLLPKPTQGELLTGEEVILDCAALAEGEDFFSIGDATISLDHSLIAYSVDTAGDEHYEVTVVDLRSGETLDQHLHKVGSGLEFSADGKYLYYARVDDAWRNYQVWRHEVGRDQSSDVLIYSEQDAKFSVYFGSSRAGHHLVIGSHSTTSTEYRLLDLREADSVPFVVAPRAPELEYSVEVADDHLLITHNLYNPGFEVATAPLAAGDSTEWTPLLTAAAGERIGGVDYFDAALAVTMRTGGLAGVRIIPRSHAGWDVAGAWELSAGGELDTVNLDDNRMVEARSLRYSLTSMLTPSMVCEVDLATHEVTVLKQTEVPGFDRAAYIERRLWARADDGTHIPISLVARADLEPDGSNPGLVYGYGSYEVSTDPSFVVSRLSLLDRGIVFALAHVRGGGELGRDWYEQGKLLNKRNTFTDFVAVGRHLIDSGWVAPGRLAAEGGSAGGLLVGAAANIAPELFRAIHAAVPFVDALTTILNPDAPLTVGEWEEWGNPLESAEVYGYMKSYAPYENIRAADYPAILVTTSMNDIRVSFAEPTKWVAMLREVVTSDLESKPILLQCELVAGHGGPSGRYNQWRHRAEELAFLIDQLGCS